MAVILFSLVQKEQQDKVILQQQEEKQVMEQQLEDETKARMELEDGNVVLRSKIESLEDQLEKAKASEVEKTKEIERLKEEVKKQREAQAAKAVASQSSYKEIKENKSVQVSRGSTGIRATFEVTAYTANCEGCSGIAFNGERPTANHTLACPPQLEIGTKVTIPALGTTYTCEDRGGAIKGRRLDVFVPTKSEALTFGRQRLEVIIQR